MGRKLLTQCVTSKGTLLKTDGTCHSCRGSFTCHAITLDEKIKIKSKMSHYLVQKLVQLLAQAES